MVRWQYRIVNVGIFNQGERLADSLGALGADGWELVAVYDKGSNWLAGMEKGFALFKRSVPEGVEPEGPWAAVNRADDFHVLPTGPRRCVCGQENPADAKRCNRRRMRFRT